MLEKSINKMIHLCHEFYQKNLVCSTGGNVSIRIGNDILITPTGVSLGSVKDNELVRINLDGQIINKGNPSKEYKMHLMLYQVNKNCQIVVHIHSSYIIAASCLNKPNSIMPIYTPGYASRIGYVKILPFYIPGSKQLSEAVSKEMGKNKAVILMNHGLVTWGNDFEKAKYIIEEIEENAKIFILTNGKGVPLSEKEISLLRNHKF